MIKIYESDNLDNPTTLPTITGATLLSIEEAGKYLSNGERKYHNGWWLRSPGSNWFAAAFVDKLFGAIYDYTYGYYVNYKNFCVRPALIINLESSSFKVGDTFEINGYKFKLISHDLAWMYNSDIGLYPFNENGRDGNDYNTSDVKRYVDNWFNTEIKPYV